MLGLILKAPDNVLPWEIEADIYNSTCISEVTLTFVKVALVLNEPGSSLTHQVSVDGFAWK